jgi:hypothetical protein
MILDKLLQKIKINKIDKFNCHSYNYEFSKIEPMKTFRGHSLFMCL